MQTIHGQIKSDNCGHAHLHVVDHGVLPGERGHGIAIKVDLRPHAAAPPCTISATPPIPAAGPPSTQLPAAAHRLSAASVRGISAPDLHCVVSSARCLRATKCSPWPRGYQCRLDRTESAPRSSRSTCGRGEEGDTQGSAETVDAAWRRQVGKKRRIEGGGRKSDQTASLGCEEAAVLQLSQFRIWRVRIRDRAARVAGRRPWLSTSSRPRPGSAAGRRSPKARKPGECRRGRRFHRRIELGRAGTCAAVGGGHARSRRCCERDGRSCLQHTQLAASTCSCCFWRPRARSCKCLARWKGSKSQRRES